MILALVLAALPAGAAAADDYDTSGPWSRTLRPGALEALPWQDTWLTSQVDGERIHVAWRRPDTAQPVPVIVVASPYLGSDITQSSTTLPFLVDNFVAHGFAVAGVSVRGTGRSGGCMELFGPKETSDASQAITWLATRPWANGKAAMYGSSYEGSTPWSVAGTGNPHLAAIVPMNGIPAVGDLMYRDGAAHSVNGPAIAAAYSAGHALRSMTHSRWDPLNPDVPWTLDVIGDAPDCDQTLKGALASPVATGTGGADPLGYFAARDHREAIAANYRGAVFNVMGLEDWNVPPHATIPFAQRLADKGLIVHQLIHEGGHWWPDYVYSQGTMRWDWAELLLRFFDAYLRGGPAFGGNTAEVQSPDGRWWGLDSFPSRDAQLTRVPLSGNGPRTLLTPQGWNGSRFNQFLGLDSLPPAPGTNFEMDIAIDEATLVSGLPSLDVRVMPTGPGGHVTAWLLDVGPDGTEVRRAWAQLNLAYADGSGSPAVVQPGHALRARLEFEPVHFVVEPGHELRLRVWQYSAGENAPSTVPAPIVLHHAAGDSALDIPTLPLAGEFLPPGLPPAAGPMRRARPDASHGANP